MEGQGKKDDLTQGCREPVSLSHILGVWNVVGFDHEEIRFE